MISPEVFTALEDPFDAAKIIGHMAAIFTSKILPTPEQMLAFGDDLDELILHRAKIIDRNRGA